MRERIEQLREFKAIGEDGRVYLVIEYVQHIEPAEQREGSGTLTLSITSLCLADGDPVNLLSQGVYEIARTHQRLTATGETVLS